MICSFSGGKTSAFMAIKMRQLAINLGTTDHNVFMNTGLEHEETYKFINNCDKEFGLNIVWLESVVHHGERKGCTHKVVSYETAHRGIGLFVEMVKKYGIMAPGFFHCTRELKLNPFKSWKKENAPNDRVAIGIRADEIDRMDENAGKKNIEYPLVKRGVTKDMINKFWSREMPFTLEIPEDEGNCLLCNKKSDRKLYTLAKKYPDKFNELAILEEMDTSRKMFRRHRTTRDILRESQVVNFKTFVDPYYTEGCKESCEVF